MNAETPRGVRVIEVIEVTATRGAGIAPDLLRLVRQYYDFDGTLLAEYDPVSDDEHCRELLA